MTTTTEEKINSFTTTEKMTEISTFITTTTSETPITVFAIIGVPIMAIMRKKHKNPNLD